MNNKTLTIKIAKLADLETVFGASWRKVWSTIKERTGSKVRAPKSVDIHVDPRAAYLNDGEMGKRFAIDLATGELSETSLHMSSGDWAVHAGSNNDHAVNGLARNAGLITVVWHDYYRYLSVTLQVHPEALSSMLPKAA